MSYKFVKVTTYYQAYLNNYYSRFPNVTEKAYSEQYDHLMADAFGWADFFARNLRKIGIEAYEIIANAKPLQKAWADEHGFKDYGETLLVKQLQALKPDIVFWGNYFNGDFIDYVKDRVGSIRQNIGYCGGPYNKNYLKEFGAFDCILSGSSEYVSEFRKHGFPSYRLCLGFEHSLLSRIKENNGYPKTDIIFSGNLIKGLGYHNLRVKILEELLAQDVTIQIHSPLSEEKFVSLSTKQCAYLCANTLKMIGLRRLVPRLPGISKAANWSECPKRTMYSKTLKEKVLHPLFGLEMFKAISKARIGFNSHIDASGSVAGNMRLFEVTGVGTCLITDHKKNIGDFFEPDKEIVTYKCVEECVEKIKWLLDNPLERERIAKAGQNRTLRDHTYERRAVELDEIVRRLMD